MPDTSTDRRYGGLDADERRSLRRDRLIAAALEGFATRGFSSTAIEALCAAGGVTPRHFYEQFPSKEALLGALYDEVVETAAAAVAVALADAPADAETRVRVGLAAFLGAYLDDPRRGRIACIEIVGVSGRLERHRREVLHRFAEVVAAQARDLGVGEVDPLHALALVGGTNELVIEWLVAEPADRPDVDRLVDVLAALYLAAWRGRRG